MQSEKLQLLPLFNQNLTKKQYRIRMFSIV